LISPALLLGLLFLQSPTPPTSIEEQPVHVEYVLLDINVVDRRGAAIEGLTKSDFDLRIDRQRWPVKSVDRYCPQGAISDPPSLALGAAVSGWKAPDLPRQIVLAFDYRHLDRVQRTALLEPLIEGLGKLHAAGDQVMIVALTDHLRVEQSFSADPSEISGTLERMRSDITLWEPGFHHLHDRATFDGLVRLTALLGQFAGVKSVVFYSNWPSSGLHYDPDFDRLSALSAASRVRFFPVWSRGLTTSGSSARMARLAVESGGRFTERTNDLSLGYARAQRETSCYYTIGFDDPGPHSGAGSGLDAGATIRERRVSIRLNNREHKRARLLHASRYAMPSAMRRLRTETAAAWLQPQRFASDRLVVQRRLLRKLSDERFEVEFSATLLDEDSTQTGEPLVLRFELFRGERQQTRLRQKSEPIQPGETIHWKQRLRADDYRYIAVVAGESSVGPFAASASFELPAADGK
jgi:VWFA-related protein